MEPFDPEALGSAAGCSVPPRHRLLWPHPSFWPAPGGLSFQVSRAWSLPRGCVPEGPCFILRILLVVPLPVPRRTGWPETIRCPSVIAFARMRRARRPRVSHLNRNTRVSLRGCRIRLMLRPDELLALLRQGRLHSSFHSMSHLAGTSNMTTRANRQFPAAGLTPAGFAALQAAPHSGQMGRSSPPGSGVARRS